MNTPKLRRAQTIAPFGPGAIHILKGGMAVVTAGLDYWFKEAASGKEAYNEQLAATRLQEPRLQKRLGVSHFRISPGPECKLPDTPVLSVPLFRFPTWFVCPRCGTMRHLDLKTDGILRCKVPECKNEAMRQISFAAVCDHGHLQDFPWEEWVHREALPSCNGQLKYKAGGSGSLDDIHVECTCGKRRSLAGVMSGKFDDPGNDKPEERTGWSALTAWLTRKSDREEGKRSTDGERNEPFPCQGGRVWLGQATGTRCHRPLRAVLINATNVHYARVESALWIPVEGEPDTVKKLRIRMDGVEERHVIRLKYKLGDELTDIVRKLKTKFAYEFGSHADDDVLQALKIYLELERPPAPDGAPQLEGELGIRWPEYGQLSKDQADDEGRSNLVIRQADVSKLPEWLKDKIETVSLLDRVMETRAFTGFSRLLSVAPEGAPGPQTLLWDKMPGNKEDRWLPAVQVFGEGVFIRFKEERLRAWENTDPVNARILPLIRRYERVLTKNRREREEVSPRRVMLHTLAHILIRRLVFSCGYGSASLRERLYVSENKDHPMAGILIYTASGDCEGSMGGLVRMGEPEQLAATFEAALEDARWCSSDPVCEESSVQGGQGTDGLNVAACHSCALLPETSCELFNRFLDRGLVTNYFN